MVGMMVSRNRLIKQGYCIVQKLTGEGCKAARYFASFYHARHRTGSADAR